MRLSKNLNSNISPLRNFVLLGDPAQDIAFPDYNIVTTEINGSPVGTPDTLPGLSAVSVKGEIVDATGVRLDWYNGIVYPKVFDKWTTFSTLANQPKSHMQTFQAQNSVLFEGKSTVTAGGFEFSFKVPYDVNIRMGSGKISYYSKEKESDANGFSADVVFGGRDPAISPVNEGPGIHLYMDDRSFTDGGVTGLSPLLIADLSDPDGINHLGLGIGHEILAVVDEEWSHPLVLDNFYSPDADTYASGTATYPFENLPIGRHTLTVKAWDMYNNPSEKTLSFFVFEHPVAEFRNVTNYPNPFRDYTHIVIRATESGQVVIRIFTLDGKLVRTLEYDLNGPQLSASLAWDGTDENGHKLSSGIYPCRFVLNGSNGGYSQTSLKLIIQR
jgi:hypothetical protein